MKIIEFLEMISNKKHYRIIALLAFALLSLLGAGIFASIPSDSPGWAFALVFLMMLWFVLFCVALGLPEIMSRISAAFEVNMKESACACCGQTIQRGNTGGSIGKTDDGKRILVCRSCKMATAGQFTYNTKTGEAFVPGSETGHAAAKQSAADQEECAFLRGFKKFDAMQAIEAKNLEKLSDIEGRLGDLLLSGAGQERERDWAVQGGLAAGIAGPAAGIAAAADTIAKNQQIRERNEARYRQGNDLRVKSMTAKLNNSKRITEHEFLERYTVDVSWSPETLFSYLTITTNHPEYDIKTKAVKIEAQWKKQRSAPCIDGALRAKLYGDHEKCIGCAYLLFPKTGTGENTFGSLTGVSVLPKRYAHYSVKIEPIDLWELAPKGREHGKTDGLTVRKHNDIVRKYKTDYQNEIEA